MPVILGALASYLLGSIPTAWIVARLVRGVDLRAIGSGNLGATNLYRQMGWKWAVPVGLFDMLKGTIPVVLFAAWAGAGLGAAITFGLLAVVGHVYPIFMNFRGGKGVATGGGVVLGLAPLAFVLSLIVWAVIVRLTGYVSLGSILSAAVLPPAILLLHPGRVDIVWPIAVLALVVIWMHRANIRRLMAGTEHRFGRAA